MKDEVRSLTIRGGYVWGKIPDWALRPKCLTCGKELDPRAQYPYCRKHIGHCKERNLNVAEARKGQGKKPPRLCSSCNKPIDRKAKTGKCFRCLFPHGKVNDRLAVTVRLSPEDHAEVLAYATESGQPVATALRDIITWGLESMDAGQKSA